jgi:tetratricopeptide (TPR) repeat protein
LDEALALNELGHVTRRLDDISSALGYLERARKLLEEGDIIEKAFNERELGICLAPTDPKVAENHLKRAVDLYRISGATAELATTFKALGDLYAARGDTDLALDALREGLAAVEERSA